MLLASAVGHKDGGERRSDDRGMRRNENKSPPRGYNERSSEQRRVNTRKIVERVEYEYEYEEDDSPRRRDSPGRRPPPRRHHGRYWDRGYDDDDDDDCYADNEDVDDYGIPMYFFVFTSRPARPRNGFFVFAFFGGQPPYWFRERLTTRKTYVSTTNGYRKTSGQLINVKSNC